jgi:hypothetical protein
MKLIFCPHCFDVVKLEYVERQCRCGAAKGHYMKDGLHATINSAAVPLGFANNSLVAAVKKQPEDGWGQTFNAFVIPKKCDTVAVDPDPDEEQQVTYHSPEFKLVMACHQYFAHRRMQLGCPFDMSPTEKEIWDLIKPYEDAWRKWRLEPEQAEMLQKDDELILEMVGLKCRCT